MFKFECKDKKQDQFFEDFGSSPCSANVLILFCLTLTFLIYKNGRGKTCL